MAAFRVVLSRSSWLPLALCAAAMIAAALIPRMAAAVDSDWKALLDRLPESLGAPAQPGLMAGPEDFDQARRRISAQPMAEWWSEENKVFADKALATDLAVGCAEPERALYTRACAFVWRIDRKPEHLAKALEGLKAMGRGGWSRASKPWLDESEAVVQYVQALDLLQERIRLSEALRGAALKTLLAAGEELYRQSSTLIPANNWRFSVSWALAMLALELPRLGADPREMAGWLRRGMEEMGSLTGGERVVSIPPERVGENPLRRFVGPRPATPDGSAQISPDGVFGEGPTYSRWQWMETVEFALALRRTLGLDLLMTQRMSAWGRWHIQAMLPNGEMPPLGDAYGYTHIDTQMAGSLWLVHDMALGYVRHWYYGHNYSRRPAALEISILYFDPTLTGTPLFGYPPGTIFARSDCTLTKGGMAILRSDWTPTQTEVILQGSSPLWVGRDPAGHRHPDATSILVWAKGEPLVVEGGCPVDYDDPAYASYYNTPRAHNLILIDGQGPYQGYVQLDRTTKAATPTDLRRGGPGPVMRASYASCDIERTVWLVDDSFIVVGDRVRRATSQPQLAVVPLAPPDKRFEAEWLLHSPDPHPRIGDDGAFSWRRGKAALAGAFLEDVALSAAPAKWGDDKTPAEGAAVSARQTGVEASFTALMAVGDSELSVKRVQELPPRLEARCAGRRVLLGAGPSGKVKWMGRTAEVDADLWALSDADDGARSEIDASRLRSLTVDGESWVNSPGGLKDLRAVDSGNALRWRWNLSGSFPPSEIGGPFLRSWEMMQKGPVSRPVGAAGKE
ncbi:MAG: heparinase II/III family protein [Candidatus Sumerlaeota bacterium]|nr:heparinase II/III family protein [Candidatus Sumerlaeota bacterium]